MTISLPTTTLAVLATLALPLSTAAQQPQPELSTGDRIRAYNADLPRPLVGTFVGFHNDALLLRQQRDGIELELPLDRIQRLERSTPGDPETGFLRGAFIGGGGALLGGLLLSAAPSGGGANMAMAGAVLVGVPVGILVGGLAGRSAWGERWQPVPIPDR